MQQINMAHSERNRTARVSIGLHRTHDKNTNIQIAAGSGSIGWHGLGSDMYKNGELGSWNAMRLPA